MEYDTKTEEVTVHVTEFDTGDEHKTHTVIDFLKKLLSQSCVKYDNEYAAVAETLVDVGLVDVDVRGSWYLPDDNRTEAVELCKSLIVSTDDNVTVDDLDDSVFGW